MSWILAVLLALASFGAIAFAFGLPRKAWAALLCALALGLAGYGLQASPSLKGSPRAASTRDAGQEGWALVELRREMLGDDIRSRNNILVTADALTRQGQFENAARLLRGAVHDNSRDAEAWLALANALTFHADGTLTPAALHAYREADAAAPQTAGPAFFIGWALIRQGQLIEAREVWAGQLAAMPEGAPGRDALAKRLANLDALLREIGERARENGQ